MNIYTPKSHQEDPDIIEEVPQMPPTSPVLLQYFFMNSNAPLQEGVSGDTHFFLFKDGELSKTKELTISKEPSEASIYYESVNLDQIRNSGSWTSSQSSSRTLRGLKFANGETYIINLAELKPNKVTFIGWCGSSERVLKVNQEEYISPGDKKKFFIHDFQGSFSEEIKVECQGDFYGILIITVDQTPQPVSPGYYLGWYDRTALRSTQDPSNPEEMPCWRILHVNTLEQENIKITRNLYPQGDRSFTHIWNERHKYNYQFFI